jgi:gamma-glutamyltranspeptidase/glutathione hydrolase/leukotriene-C4 hydrolase
MGGGFHMTIYIKSKNLVECLDAREVAPKKSHEQMFVNDNKKSSLEGGLSIAVPGELKGMWELHQRHGKLPWSELFKPVIDLCRNGHEVTEYLERVLNKKSKDIKAIPSLREIFVDPETGELWKAGTRIKRLALANTLETIAKEGADTMYGKNGTIGRQMLEDIRDFGGILTEEDFADYKVKWLKPVETTLKNGERLYSMPLSGSGALLVFIMNLLRSYDLKHDALSYHRIMEAYKLAYARRSELADPEFVASVDALVKNLTSLDYANELRKKIDDKKTHNNVEYYGGQFSTPEDHGTAHISILAPNGDAISATGTINYILGSLRRSKTGIVLNDEMDDFSTPGKENIYGIPPSEANYIKPGKRPMSSMAPTIVVNADGNVGLVIGSAGGSRITTAIAHTIINYYFFKSKESLWNVFDMKRLHHQLLPNHVEFENGFDEQIVSELGKSFNHSMFNVTETIGFGALVGVYVDHESVQAAYDPRRGGSSEVF